MAKGLTSKNKRRVHFDPNDVDIVVGQSENLLKAAIDAEVHINASCGGAGVCGTCKVLIKEGEVESTRTEKLSAGEYKKGFRQACQSQVLTDLVVHIPVESRLETAVLDREKEEMTEGSQQVEALADGWRFNPPLSKIFIKLSPPTLKDNTSDLSRLLRELKQQYKLSNVSADFGVVNKLAKVLRYGKWAVTVTTLLTGDETRLDGERGLVMTNIEPGDTREKHYTLAFDIGTTGVRAQLIDLNRGKALARGVDYNGQISYGEDVISRIACSQKRGGLKKLQKAVVTTINGIIKGLLPEAKVEEDRIGHMVWPAIRP